MMGVDPIIFLPFPTKAESNDSKGFLKGIFTVCEKGKASETASCGEEEGEGAATSYGRQEARGPSVPPLGLPVPVNRMVTFIPSPEVIQD